MPKVMTRTPLQIQKSVVFALFIRELRTRFGSYKGGYLWLVIEPMAHIIALSFIFSFIRQREMGAIDFPVFLVTGVVPFLLFKNITLRVMEGVNANKALFVYRQVLPMDTFLARTLLDGFLSILVFALLLAGMAWLGMNVPFRDPLTVIIVYAMLIAMGLGLGMVLCVATHYLPEARTFIRILMMPLYLTSGIIFPISILPEQFHPYLLWNPILHAIELMRDAFFVNFPMVPGVSPLFFLMSTLALLFIGLSWYRVKRYDILAI